MAYKKIDKEFCLTDESVNVYGYRLLTSGLEIERFKPAIGFLMHDRDRGIAVKWEDFRVDGDRLLARPVVNETLFPDLAKQIEDGFYAAASVGHIVALEVSDDPADKLEGQTSVTVKRWFPRECSIVDIPGNYNALAQLYDETDSVLHDLSDNCKPEPINNNMDKKTISASDLLLPDLTADSTIEQINQAIKDLTERAEKASALETELRELKESRQKEQVENIIKRGMDERRLTKELADRLKADYSKNPEGLKALVMTMPSQKSVRQTLSEGDVPERYRGKTFRDLYLSGEWETVRKDYPDLADKLRPHSPEHTA